MKSIGNQTLLQCTGTAIAIAVLSILLVAGANMQAAWAAGTDGTASSPLVSGEIQTPADEGVQAKAKPAGIKYRARLIGGNWQNWKANGKNAGSLKGSKKLGALAFKLANAKESSIQYQVHIAGAGWTDVRSNGKSIGSPASRKPIDAVRVALTGPLSKTHDVVYRVNAGAIGWQAWKKNGTIAGSASNKIPIRAIQVELVQKAKAAKKAGTGIVGVRYRAQTQQGGWSTYVANDAKAIATKKHQKMTGLSVKIDTGVYTGSIYYRVRDLDGRWHAWQKNGEAAVASQGISAVKMKLKGKISKYYDVVYRASMNDIGWQRRMRNGEIAGSNEGNSWQIESIKVKLVPKSKASGWIEQNGTWAYYKSGAKLRNTWLVTAEHPIYTMTSGLQRYWVDADGALAVNRYVNPADARDSNAGWTAYAGDCGFVIRGKCTIDDGMLLANPVNGELYTSTRWVTTSDFDGEEQRYRVVKKGVAAVVQTGLFTVAGKQYYGWEDGRGYLMRNDTYCIGGTWYHANEKGVLKKWTRKEIVERYVKWAIDTANDDSHGYSQANRWGPDYDCSSFVCASLLAAGFPDSGASWTGNMRSCLRKVGFTWYKGTAKLKRGDIMLVHNNARQHTEIYLGNGLLVGAHISENGTIYGKAGDQTGREICIGKYYNAPWQGYLRFTGAKK